MRELLRTERGLRPLLLAHTQSSLGTGAAYVALLVVAYDRFDSALAASAVLLSDLLPAIVLGAVVGAAADRWSRKAILVGADVLRAAAFIGIALTGSFALTIAFAAVAGVGQAAFQPAVMASLGDVVSRERLAAATGLYGTIGEFGYTAGPILAAGLLAVTGAATVLALNGATFVVSAALLLTLRVAPRPPGGEATDFLGAIREGVRALRRLRLALAVMVSAGAFAFCLGAVNVAELVLVRRTLDGTESQYALFVAAMGLGLTVGSWLGARATEERALSRYLSGMLAVSGATLACGLAPSFAVAVVAAAALGAANGIANVAQNVALQSLVPAELKGRVFGLKGTLFATAFGLSYLSAGAFIALTGARAAFVVLAGLTLAVWLLAATVLARTGTPTQPHPIPDAKGAAA